MPPISPATWTFLDSALFDCGVRPVTAGSAIVACDGREVLTWDCRSGDLLRRDELPDKPLALLAAPEGLVIWSLSRAGEATTKWQARDAATGAICWTRTWSPGPPRRPLLAGRPGTAWLIGPTSPDQSASLVQIDLASGQDLVTIEDPTASELAHDRHGLIVARLSPGQRPGLERIPLPDGERRSWSSNKCELLDLADSVILISERDGPDRIRTARDATDGRVLWQVAGGAGLCRDRDTVFVGVGPAVHALDLHTGTVRWKSSLPGAHLSLKAGAGRVWADDRMGPMTVLDSRDGSFLEQTGELPPHIIEDAGVTALFHRHGLEVWVD